MRRVCVHQFGFPIRYGTLLLVALVAVSCPPPAEELDDHGDTPSQATALVVGGSGVGGKVGQGDEDFFWFDGQFGAVYTVATAENGGIQVTVVDDDLQEVPLPPGQKDHEVAFQALWTGRYYIRVGSESASSVTYEVSAELSAPSPGVAVAEIMEADSPILSIAADEAGNRVIFHRNLEGADPRASRALTMVSADGMDMVNIHHDEDGLPILMDSNTGYSFVFGNWTETTVDVEVIAPDGTSQIVEDIALPMDQPLSSALKQAGGCQAHPLGTVISIGTFSVGLGSCAAAVAAVVSGTLPLAVPLALACGGATASGLALWAACAGNNVPTYVALAISSIDCLVSGGISCDTFTIDAANNLMAALFAARDNVPPVLDVYPREIYIYPEENLTNTITIRNIGGNNLEWEVVPQSADGGKLIITPPTGTTTGFETIEVLSADHSLSFSVDLLIRNKALENNWFVVTVHVIAVPTDVFVSPIEVILRPPDFTATVEVSNLLQSAYPAGLLQWHASVPTGLSVTPSAFAASAPAQNTQQVTIHADNPDETTMLSITFTNGEDPTDQSTVEVSVVPSGLSLSTTDLTLTPDSPSGIVRVQNTGAGTLSWSATWSDSSLTLDPSGAGPGHPLEFPVAESMDVIITADPNAFSSGDRTAFVTFSNDYDADNLQVLRVSLSPSGSEGHDVRLVLHPILWNKWPEFWPEPAPLSIGWRIVGEGIDKTVYTSRNSTFGEYDDAEIELHFPRAGQHQLSIEVLDSPFFPCGCRFPNETPVIAPGIDMYGYVDDFATDIPPIQAAIGVIEGYLQAMELVCGELFGMCTVETSPFELTFTIAARPDFHKNQKQ